MMMPVLPTLLFSTWLANLPHLHQLTDQNFGGGLYSPEVAPMEHMERYFPGYVDHFPFDHCWPKPWSKFLLRRPTGGTSTVAADKTKFQVVLDVRQFKPEEISVKVVDRYVVVEGKHEEKSDEHGTISRHFVRKYYLPDRVDAERLQSSISEDGVLTITAPFKEQTENKSERTIPIERTGKTQDDEYTTKPVETFSKYFTVDNNIQDEQTEAQEEMVSS